jgi:hypothetical protein
MPLGRMWACRCLAMGQSFDSPPGPRMGGSSFESRSGSRPQRSLIVRAPGYRINARRRFWHSEAVHHKEMPTVPLHRPARLNACADFHWLAIEPFPCHRYGELLNHCHHFLLSLPYRNKVTRADGDCLPEFACLPRHTADEQARVLRILFPRRDTESVAFSYGLPNRLQILGLKRQPPTLRPDYRQRPDRDTCARYVTSTAECDRMGKVKRAGSFTDLPPVGRRNDPGDLGAQFPPLQAGADHQTDCKHGRPQATG